MSDTQTDDWTEEKYIQLIREYRARPILWDPLDPLFYKKTIQPAAWDDIAHVLNIDPEECKRKMMVIIWRFKREKTKLINILRNQSDQPVKKYTSTWFAFKEMAFMLDKDTERKRQLNGVSTEDDGEIPSIKMTFLKRQLQTPNRTDTKNTITDNKKMLLQTTNKYPVRTETTTLEAIPSSSQALPNRNEEIKCFTSFIENKMKNYTDVTKNAVQQAICDIIFKADQNYYETSTNQFKMIGKDPLEKMPFDAYHHGVQIKQQPFSDSE